MQSRRFFVLVLALAGTVLAGFTTLTRASPDPQSAPSPAKPATPDPLALIAQGKTVYGSLDCNTCHILNKTGTAVGPELTLIGKTWTQPKLKTMLRHPLQIAPKGFMPAYDKTKINATQMKALIAYLASLK